MHDLAHYLRHYATEDVAPRTERGKSTDKARRETIARRKARAYKRGAMTTTKNGR